MVIATLTLRWYIRTSTKSARRSRKLSRTLSSARSSLLPPNYGILDTNRTKLRNNSMRRSRSWELTIWICTVSGIPGIEVWGLTHWVLFTVVHWPIAFASGRGLFPSHPSIVGQIELDNDTTLVDTWKAMIKLPKSKVRRKNTNLHCHFVLIRSAQVRSIGVSNFTIEHLEGIIKATGVVPVSIPLESSYE